MEHLGNLGSTLVSKGTILLVTRILVLIYTTIPRIAGIPSL
jgi:hypothetical protein